MQTIGHEAHVSVCVCESGGEVAAAVADNYKIQVARYKIEQAQQQQQLDEEETATAAYNDCV